MASLRLQYCCRCCCYCHNCGCCCCCRYQDRCNLCDCYPFYFNHRNLAGCVPIMCPIFGELWAALGVFRRRPIRSLTESSGHELRHPQPNIGSSPLSISIIIVGTPPLLECVHQTRVCQAAPGSFPCPLERYYTISAVAADTLLIVPRAGMLGGPGVRCTQACKHASAKTCSHVSPSSSRCTGQSGDGG